MPSNPDPPQPPQSPPAHPRAPGATRQRRAPQPPDDLPIGATITALTPTKRDPRRIAIRVANRYAGALPADIIESLALRVGTRWTEEADEALRAAIDRDAARRYAIASLSRRAAASGRLAGALARRGHDQRTIAHTIEDLQRLGLIDDHALAESLARSLLSRAPAGQRLIETKLIARGIPAPIARTTAASAASSRDTTGDALECARKKARSLPQRLEPDAARRRIYAALARRGFPPDACAIATRQAMDEHLSESPSEHHPD
ncbi:MAG: regulatory protein RecX [Phycisphaerales bacterium]